MSEQNTRRTPLFACHQKHKGRIVDFAGWDMPVQYEGIVAEHQTVREHVGVFDVSHMGRVEIRGKDALSTIQTWITNDASSLDDGQAVYSPICYEDGGIVDDCIVYRLAEHHYLIVVNASNREKDFDWFSAHTRADADVQLSPPDEGDKWALLAVQGPKARALLSRLHSADLGGVAHNHLVHGSLAGIADCMLACTGYTGEDGFEVFVPEAHAVALWDALMTEGEQDSIAPCGLGARDTLRMEMRYPLYGNDIDKTTTPIEAGLSWTVKPDKGDFIGRETIVAQLNSKPPRRLVGFEMEGRGIPRHGYEILDADGEQVLGQVTSGGFAPSLQRPIGIGYVPAKPHFAKPGSTLQVQIRKKRIPIKVVKTPFYRKS